MNLISAKNLYIGKSGLSFKIDTSNQQSQMVYPPTLLPTNTVGEVFQEYPKNNVWDPDFFVIGFFEKAKRVFTISPRGDCKLYLTAIPKNASVYRFMSASKLIYEQIYPGKNDNYIFQIR